MKRSKARLAACMWLDLLIVVVAVQVLGPTDASAFYLWPLRRARDTVTNNIHSQESSMTRHRAAPQTTSTSTSTTTTTTTTTTQIPPIELLFEINPEDLNQQQQQQRQPELNEGPDELAVQSANDTLILEDLVNQFERNFNLKSHVPALNFRAQSNRSVQYIGSSTEASPEQAARVSTQSNDSEAQQEPDLASEWLSRQQSDSLVEAPDPRDLDLDRHIQYDTLTSAAEFTQQQQQQQQISRQDKQAHPIITSNSSGRLLLDYKPADDQVELNETMGELSDMNQTLAANTQNLTLNPIRKLDFDFQLPTLIVSRTLSNVSGQVPSSPAQNSSTGNETASQLEASSSTINLRASNSSHIQARSMSSGSSASRVPQHTKPPYASYNQFHQRPDHQAAASSDLKRSTQTSDDPTKAIGVLSADAWTVLGNQTIATTTNNKLDTTKATATTSTPTTTTTSTTTPKPPTLVHQLQDYLTNGFSQRQDDNNLEELERVASKLAPANELIELSPLPSVPAENQSRTPAAISERHFMSSNGVPTASSPHAQVHQDNHHHPGGRYQNDRLAVSDNQLRASIHSTMDTISNLEGNYQQLSLSEPANQMSTISRAMSSSFAPETSSAGSSQTAHDLRNGTPLVLTNGPTSLHNNNNNNNNLDSNLGARSQYESKPLENDNNRLPSVPQLHKKTIETLSSQIQHSDKNQLMGQSSNTDAVHQLKERSPPAQMQPQALHRDANLGGAGGGTYAASLINVTAPMVLPLSATEAMEASLGGDLAARHQMMHRVAGHSEVAAGSSQEQASDRHSSQHNERPAPSVQMQAHKLNGHTYYATPGASSSLDHLHSRHTHRQQPLQSVYSRPVNQFRQTSITTHSPAAPFGSNQLADAISTLAMSEGDRMRLGDSFLASSSSPPLVTSGNSQQASGFRSPFGQYPTASTSVLSSIWPPQSAGRTTGLPMPSNYLNELAANAVNPAAISSPTTTTTTATTVSNKYQTTTQATPASSSMSPQNRVQSSSSSSSSFSSSFSPNKQNSTLSSQQQDPTTSNDFIIGSVVNATAASNSGQQTDLVATSTGNTNGNQLIQQLVTGIQTQQAGTGADKRAFNLTRVEHISAECSSDMIKAIIIFNGTFKGIIYASGYVRDPNCLFINGTGKTRYDFSIKLNQCGTVGRNEIHPAAGPNEVRRRDQVMYNSLSIQYNPIIEQEWDEHFRVSCEYGSDFWKTISFSPFNVQTNTDSPVVFTVDPPQCQMEILKGHGMVGPRQEAVSGPVTVGDPLTLLIHMKSEKAGYDILVKNCIAHNGGQQKMQLIDANGCVVNERFISPFRGTYNDNDLKHVTLYSYLKAFRFTGSPVLYLECEVHMCQSACPPQMCYWRRLSKRSTHRNESRLLASDGADEFEFDYGYDTSEELPAAGLTKFNFTTTTSTTEPSSTTVGGVSRTGRQRRGRKMPEEHEQEKKSPTKAESSNENLSDKVSLFQALEVRQEREPDTAASSMSPYGDPLAHQQEAYEQQQQQQQYGGGGSQQLMCYQQASIFAFLFTVASILLASISVTIGCYCRASSLKRQALNRAKKQHLLSGGAAHPLSLSSANLCYSPISPACSSSSASSPSCSPSGNRPSHPRAANNNNNHQPYLASFLVASDKPASATLYGPSTIATKSAKSLLQTPASSLGALLNQHHHEQQHRQQQQHRLGPVLVAKKQ